MPPPHPFAIQRDPEAQREALRLDARQAWAAYQDSGLHVTGAEVDGWLAHLEAGQDVDPPDCHM